MGANGTSIWWNGELMLEERALVPVTQIGWTGVAAVFEGMRGYWNADRDDLHIFRLDAHMERFMRSMRLMRMEPHWNQEELMAACVEVVRANDYREDIYLQPLAYAGDAARGNFFNSSGCDIYVTQWPAASSLLTGASQTACISSYRRINEDAMPPRVKNLSNYRNSQLAYRDARLSGYDAAILLNSDGHVAEGPSACVFLVRDSVVITPDLTSGILESITRDAMIALCREALGLRVEERIVDRTELYVADEVFLTGNAAEVMPITAVDRQMIGGGGIGTVTERLIRLLHDIARGIVPEYASWRTSVGMRAVAPSAAR